MADSKSGTTQAGLQRDLKRFEDSAAAFEKTALLFGFLNLFVAIWVRSPGLQMNPGSVTGLSIVGFNVGHGIVLGPLIAMLSMAVLVSSLYRRNALRQAVGRSLALSNEQLSPGDRLVLGTFGDARFNRLERFTDSAWRTFWYFLIPAISAFLALRRYCDFVPNEAAKAWSLMGRIEFLFFGIGGWEIRPILPARELESANLMMNLPYIYAPLQSWIELGLFAATCLLAWQAWRQYYSGLSSPMQQPR